jgi:hypothetical protein
MHQCYCLFFFGHPNDSLSFLKMEPNSARFFFWMPALKKVLTLKNCEGQQKDLPLKKVNSHHGPILKYPCLPKVESTND